MEFERRIGSRQQHGLITAAALAVALTSLPHCSVAEPGQDEPSAPRTVASDAAVAQPPGSARDGGEVDAAPPPPEAPPKQTVFMAAGHMGRTVLSCDDGLTWIRDQSADDEARCWVDGDPHYVECDHTPYSGTGLDAGDGWFFVQNGWGADGTVRRSRNGIDWEVVKSGGWGGGLVYSAGTVLVLWESGWLRSADQGASFAPLADYGSYDHPFVSRVGTTFFVVGRGGALAVSHDSGQTFQASVYQDGWGGSFAAGNGILVATGQVKSGETNLGYSSTSADDGKTWTPHPQFDAPGRQWASRVLFNGTHFVNWVNGEVWKSTDGVAWEKTPTAFPGWWAGPVAYSAKTGTYVAVQATWGANYDKQHAFRSSDGVLWTELDAEHFRGGHPISRVVAAEVDPAICAVP